MPRQMIENERSTTINPSETTEETVSLSDRFGLWIGFHSIDQNTYIEMIEEYINFKSQWVSINHTKRASAILNCELREEQASSDAPPCALHARLVLLARALCLHDQMP